MKFDDVVESIIHCYHGRIPMFISGPPGVGKSAAFREAVRRISADIPGFDSRDERLSQMDPVDLRGVPVPDLAARVTDWLPPAFLPRDMLSFGLMLMDELNAANMAVQVAAYQIILDRRLGDYRLPDGWSIIAAGNRQEDRAAAVRMSTALANRFVHIEQSVDVDGWLEWYWSQDLPEEIGFYVGFRREALHRFDPASKDLAFPTPRSWEMAARLYARNLPPAIEHQLIAGAIGAGAAAEFLAFCRIYKDLPSLDGILLDPTGSVVPEEPSARAAVASGLAKRAAPSNIESILQYVGRLPKEFEFLTARLARRFCPSVEQTRAMAAWMARNSRFLVAQ